jgi:hypothetical protein
VYDVLGASYAVRWNGSVWTETEVLDPVFTARPRLANLGGELWMYGTVSGRVKAVNVENPGAIVSLGLDVDPGHEPPLDPEAEQDGLVRTAFITSGGTATFRTLGNGPRTAPVP